MGEVLAVQQGQESPDSRTRAYAAAVAEVLATTSCSLGVHGEPVEEYALIRAALGSPGTDAVVVTADSEVDGPFWETVRTAEKPVVILGSEAARVPTRVRVALVPLDGTRETAEAVAPVVSRLRRGGVEVRPVHVFDPETVPAFWDQAAHTHEPWVREFLDRHLPGAEALELRHGDPAEQLLAAASEVSADLVVVGWGRSLGRRRAATLRRCVADGRVPLLLVGRPAGRKWSGSGPSALVPGQRSG